MCALASALAKEKGLKKNGDGCFAKVWISSLEFLTKFTLRRLVAK